MFQLDDQFLADIGLAELPEEERAAFLQYIYSKLELGVGERLSEGMSDAQLEEFEAIIDKNDAVILAWIQQHAPEYQLEDGFTRLQQATGADINDRDLRDEYVATKWLEVNRGDYRQVVAGVLEEIKADITANRDAILGREG